MISTRPCIQRKRCWSAEQTRDHQLMRPSTLSGPSFDIYVTNADTLRLFPDQTLLARDMTL